MLTYHLIDLKLDTFLGECKNYDKAVSVTYIGKFCSLLLTTNIKIGIYFRIMVLAEPDGVMVLD